MKVCVDCANGVGARALHGFRALPAVARLLTVTAVNDQPAPGAGTLNNRCGAEHVQKSRTAPAGLDAARVCAYAKGGECGASSSAAADEGADRGLDLVQLTPCACDEKCAVPVRTRPRVEVAATAP